MIITSSKKRDINKKLKQIPMDEIVNEDDRLVEGWATVEVEDSDNEILPVDEMEKEMPTWIERGAPIMDSHTNKQIGKGVSWETANHPDVGKPGIKVKYKIFKGKQLDDIVWGEIKSGERKGLSWGGISWEPSETVHDKFSGSRATKLHGLEQYEVSSVKNPSCPLALNEAANLVAKTAKEENLNVSRDQITQGIKTEMEHAETVNNDMGIIVGIALDHLREDPDYYTKLAEMESTAPNVESKTDLPPRGTGRLNGNADPQETGTPRTDEERNARHTTKATKKVYLKEGEKPPHDETVFIGTGGGRYFFEEVIKVNTLEGDIKLRGDLMAEKTVKKEAPVEGESQPVSIDDRVAALEESVSVLPEINGAVSEMKAMLTKMAAPEEPEPVKPIEETKADEPEDEPKKPEDEPEKEDEEPEKPKEDLEKTIEKVAKKTAEEVAKKFTEKSSTPRPTATPKTVNKSVGLSSWDMIQQSRQPNANLKTVEKMANTIRTDAEMMDYDIRDRFHDVMKGAKG